MKHLPLILMAAAATSATANPIEGQNPGLSLETMIAWTAVSLVVGWAAHTAAQATQRFSPGTEAIIAAVAGLFIGPAIAVFLLR